MNQYKISSPLQSVSPPHPPLLIRPTAPQRERGAGGALICTCSDALNLRSSAFICGSFFVNVWEIKNPLQKRICMTRIGRIFPDHPIRANPRYPCSIAALFSGEVLDNNKQLVIKRIHLILRTLHSLRWCL